MYLERISGRPGVTWPNTCTCDLWYCILLLVLLITSHQTHVYRLQCTNH